MSAAEYRRLTLEEHQALVRWMADQLDQRPRAGGGLGG